MAMSSLTDVQKQKWAVHVVVLCQGNEPLHDEFMAAYKNGAVAMKALLTGTKFNMPADLADEILGQSDQDLSNQIGKWICDWLW
jgi:hypothetical protein